MSDFVNEMQRCYVRQAEAVGQALEAMPAALADFRAKFSGRRFDCVVLLGIGSSFHALRMAQSFAQQTLGVPVWTQTPEQLDWLTPAMAGRVLVIAASQSGTSTNVLARMREIRAMGIDAAVITQGLESPLAQETGCVLPLNIPEEKAGPKTMGVMGTAITAAFAACALSGGNAREQLAADVTAFRGQLAGNLPAVQDYVQARAEALAAHCAWLVVGEKRLHACAGESFLKLVETVRRPSTCYELEEIVHGPCACFSEDTALLCLSEERTRGERVQALCNLCEENGGTVYDVIAAAGPTREEDGRLLLAAPDHPMLTALMMLLPAQAISAFIPPLMGIDLDARSTSKWNAMLAGHL